MREISFDEVASVSGGDGVAAGVFVVGLGTAVGAGTPLGPVGMGVAAITYIAVFSMVTLLQ